jgi:C4-type Zn-finger protein
MPLTLDQQRTVAKHLRSRAQPPQCPVCSASNMTVQESVTLLPTDDEEPVPRINVLCEYCGHVLHFAPSALGLSME